MNKQDKAQTVSKAKGRPMLTWVGKKPLDKIEYFPAQEKEVYGDKSSKEFNKLFWGDNLQVLSHLLKEYRGKIDLIYIDPPFDSKADYIKKVKIKGEKTEGTQQSILEEKQYTDIWENDEYLQFMYERFLVIKELLSETGSLYVHCDYRKDSYLRIILDEVFGEENLVNEIIWGYRTGGISKGTFARKHDTILFYAKSNKFKFNTQFYKSYQQKKYNFSEKYPELYDKEKQKWYHNSVCRDVWEDIFPIGTEPGNMERGDYPTQKPEALLKRVIEASSDPGGIVMDCFCGSGTTLAVAQKLGRRWIGCDINIGAIQTSSKRLASIIEAQLGKVSAKLIKDDFKRLHAFKVLNVNDYDIFKNEIEAKEIVMDMYGVEPIKRSSFDGILDNNFVKVMPLNRVLNKLDIKNVLKNINDSIDSFTAKSTSKSGEEVYQEGVILICSGAELDTENYLKKENNTGVKVTIRDILNDKKNLIFKKKPEAKIEVKAKNSELSVVIKEFYSPILMRKLELENEKMIDKKAQAKVEDFKQIIESVAIDVDYDSELFNAEIIDLPDKKEIIKSKYKYHYPKKGKYTIAIKIVDVLGEEYFETFNVTA
ncbi:site-specific DNA-methyltransferase [Patescibacteria group bacterium]|nr:site-specific DNA-methyltransferase [Patescibacteria group bacterium]MCG2701817.1 site-specific DNA-methyltransferase [Candidatus Parcubacteria bacterium]MBU4265224.1 site-specific DNA-methyltransferase [Patescibacteria group bacterium]MBU4390299.1 site-specific DNA-methyltransferase [Patescibacteria group bacterium]MBU4431238.1 site-specific DNA-methyltransferase [Patescibacteria group bacterium]